MIRYILQKLLRGFLILTGAMLITFLLMHAIPGNPWANYSENRRALLNIFIDEKSLINLNSRFGLDQPLWRQFTRYLFGDVENGKFVCGAVCGNLGPSIQSKGLDVESVLFAAPIGQSFWESRFGFSLRLVFFSSLIVIFLGIPLGIISALKPQSWLSRGVMVILAALNSIPNFVLGLLAIILLASGLRIITVLPDWHDPSNWIVPAFVLGAMPMASIARVTRTAMMNVMNEDYVRTARAKGLYERQVQLVHVMRNALVPIVTYLGSTVMEMFAGLFIVENLYAFPGIGRRYWEAIINLDYPMILGLTLIYGVGIILFNLTSDILCAQLDPRIREIEQGEAP